MRSSRTSDIHVRERGRYLPNMGLGRVNLRCEGTLKNG